MAILANDILFNNSSGDIYFFFPAMTYLVNDDLGNLNEADNTTASDLISLNPLFNADFSLEDYSLLRDRGSDGDIVFTPGPFDVVGNPRTYYAGHPGAHTDIGAYEIQDVIFVHAFDQSVP